MTEPIGGVVDFRVRPPFLSFLKSDLHDSPADSGPTVFSRAGGRDRSWAQASMAEFVSELAQGGISRAVVTGRFALRDKEFPTSWGVVDNNDIATLMEDFPGTFIGFGSVDVRDTSSALTEISRLKSLGFAGVAFDNPLSSPPLFDDDASLFPLYERCEEEHLIVSLASSVFLGPDLDYSMPVHVQRVARAFPGVPVVVPHACWPWVTEACAVALQNRNVFLMPDLYLHTPDIPGGRGYLDAANVGLADQLIFGSSYPVMSLEGSVRAARALDWRDPTDAEKYLSSNAERILGWNWA